MSINAPVKPGNRLMILIFVATAVVAGLLVRTDWLMVALGPYLPVYWAVVLAWGGLRDRRHPAAAPVVGVGDGLGGALSRRQDGGISRGMFAEGLRVLSCRRESGCA